MTSKVSVSAHAGWPVAVYQLTPGGALPAVLHTVEPGAAADHYVHAGCSLLIAERQPGDDVVPTDWPTIRRAFEVEVARLLDGLKAVDGIDQRWLSIARTDIEKGFLAIERALRDVSK